MLAIFAAMSERVIESLEDTFVRCLTEAESKTVMLSKPLTIINNLQADESDIDILSDALFE